MDEQERAARLMLNWHKLRPSVREKRLEKLNGVLRVEVLRYVLKSLRPSGMRLFPTITSIES